MSWVRQTRDRLPTEGEQSLSAGAEKRTHSTDGAEGDEDLRRGAARGTGGGPKPGREAPQGAPRHEHAAWPRFRAQSWQRAWPALERRKTCERMILLCELEGTRPAEDPTAHIGSPMKVRRGSVNQCGATLGGYNTLRSHRTS